MSGLPLVAAHSNASSPIQALPPEILSKILALVPHTNRASSYYWNIAKLEYKSEFHALPSEPFHHSRTPSYSLGSDLGGVCHSWRNVSLSTPALWSYIWLDICEGLSSAYPARTIERLQAHLERSKSHPLTITLNLMYLDYRGFGDFMASLEGIHTGDKPLSWHLLQLVLNHGSHIHALYLYSEEIEEYYFASYTIPHIRNCLTNLEHIVLHLHPLGPWTDPHCIPKALSELPLLCKYDHYTAYKQPCLPNTNLTHITLDSLDISHFYSVLRELPYLTSADVRLVDDSTLRNDIAIPSPLGLRTLRMIFSGSSFDAYTSLINLLNCPSLTMLSLDEFCPIHHYWNSQYKISFPNGLAEVILAFDSFITRSPNIESLRLQPMYLKDGDALRFLRNIPRLVTLELANEEITKDFWLEMGSGDLVPKVRDLRFETHLKYFDWLAFGEMLQRRKDRGLWSAYVKLRNEMVPEIDIRLLEQLQVEGLAVRVVYSSPREEETELLGYRIQS